MSNPFINSKSLPECSLWEKMESERIIFSFELEITARCNNNCRHCYINLPAKDKRIKQKEMSLAQIKNIVDQAVELGALWCLITGGEPLLREDFFDIYLYLKKKGLLISVFTNATLITEEHIKFFKRYPPRDIEVTVYGTTEETYEKLSRNPGSFDAFMNGLDLLLKSNVRVRFKAIAMRSNAHELTAIFQFCRQRTKDYFRFDPFLHLRFDGNPKRNEEIKSERLTPEEIVVIEKHDPERFNVLEKYCDKLISPASSSHINCNHLFQCNIGTAGAFTVGYDGFFRPCSCLWHPDCIRDLKKGALAEIWQNFVPLLVKNMRSNKEEFLKKCRVCPIINLCVWCPARAHLETQELDKPVDYFCKVAHARAESLKENKHTSVVL